MSGRHSAQYYGNPTTSSRSCELQIAGPSKDEKQKLIQGASAVTNVDSDAAVAEDPNPSAIPVGQPSRPESQAPILEAGTAIAYDSQCGRSYAIVAKHLNQPDVRPISNGGSSKIPPRIKLEVITYVTDYTRLRNVFNVAFLTWLLKTLMSLFGWRWAVIARKTLWLDANRQRVYKLTFTGKNGVEVLLPDQVLRRAVSRIGEREYDQRWNNSQDFVRWCCVRHCDNKKYFEIPIMSINQLKLSIGSDDLKQGTQQQAVVRNKYAQFDNGMLAHISECTELSDMIMSMEQRNRSTKSKANVVQQQQQVKQFPFPYRDGSYVALSMETSQKMYESKCCRTCASLLCCCCSTTKKDKSDKYFLTVQKVEVRKSANECQQVHAGAGESEQGQTGAGESEQGQAGAVESEQGQTGAGESEQGQAGAGESEQGQAGAVESKQAQAGVGDCIVVQAVRTFSFGLSAIASPVPNNLNVAPTNDAGANAKKFFETKTEALMDKSIWLNSRGTISCRDKISSETFCKWLLQSTDPTLDDFELLPQAGSNHCSCCSCYCNCLLLFCCRCYSTSHRDTQSEKTNGFCVGEHVKVEPENEDEDPFHMIITDVSEDSSFLYKGISYRQMPIKEENDNCKIEAIMTIDQVQLLALDEPSNLASAEKNIPTLPNIVWDIALKVFTVILFLVINSRVIKILAVATPLFRNDKCTVQRFLKPPLCYDVLGSECNCPWEQLIFTVYFAIALTKLILLILAYCCESASSAGCCEKCCPEKCCPEKCCPEKCCPEKCCSMWFNACLRKPLITTRKRFIWNSVEIVVDFFITLGLLTLQLWVRQLTSKSFDNIWSSIITGFVAFVLALIRPRFPEWITCRPSCDLVLCSCCNEEPAIIKEEVDLKKIFNQQEGNQQEVDSAPKEDNKGQTSQPTVRI